MSVEIMSRSVSSKKPASTAAIPKGTKKNQHARLFALGITTLVVLMGALSYYYASQGARTNPAGPVSRQVLLASESDIKVLRPGPTIGALDYAYIASVYTETLMSANQSEAVYSSEKMMDRLFPTRIKSVNAEISAINKRNGLKTLTSNAQLSGESQKILNHYLQRYSSDNHTLAWDGIIPTGPDDWVQRTGPPVTPRAGDWERWNVSQPIVIAPPPVIGTAEDNRQITIVKQAVASRTGQDINLINFWAGQPGSETPGGIWQNVLFAKVQPDLSLKAISADKQYAKVQSVVAQTISDAFMECWKVKYTYWTARPDMRIPGLSTAMNDPTFPSYISGHSTISKAAADVLSVMVPKYSKTWQADADQARYSRLVAGIHFDVDNKEGYAVGSAVAQQSVTQLHLKQIL
jgi:hypothetical protein